uniref:DDE Tnp4 domain-containing protein n=1 Tax=Aegilops tauschii subsp. strangulata TaxID=200361 RepID=A0A453LXJ5_AEGTS
MGTEKLLAIGEARGFPGMLGSIDCMHCQWKNRPNGLRGMYQGHTRETTIILEAVASHDLWIWHAFFGMPGSHNDINVLQRSLVFRRLCNGESLPCNYTINGRDYNMGYYLANGIYPQWAAFVKTISEPHSNKQSLFATMQEAARKDVERAFGVLQARWGIVRSAATMWESETL